MTDFEQPHLNDADKPAPEASKDELSQAVVKANAPKPHVLAPEPPKAPGKYRLDYTQDGLPITETHAALARAVQRVGWLRSRGIAVTTSTV